MNALADPPTTPNEPRGASDSIFRPKSLDVESNFREPYIATSKIKATFSLSISLSRKKGAGRMLHSTRYSSSGLSDDCRNLFFWNESKLALFHLGSPESANPLPLELESLGKIVTKGEPIFDVAMSGNFLAIVTSQRILFVDVTGDRLLEAVRLDAWEYGGISLSESATALIIAVGKGQGSSLEASHGKIDLYKYKREGRSPKLSLWLTLPLSVNDRPKRVYLSPDARILSCVTMIRNTLLIFNLDENFSSPAQPFAFSKNRFRKVSACQSACFPTEKY